MGHGQHCQGRNREQGRGEDGVPRTVLGCFYPLFQQVLLHSGHRIDGFLNFIHLVLAAVGPDKLLGSLEPTLLHQSNSSLQPFQAVLNEGFHQCQAVLLGGIVARQALEVVKVEIDQEP